jgi:phage tail-like protein
MARSSKEDPIDKFRFRITVLAIDLSVTGGVESLLSILSDQTLPGKNRFKLLSRSGFQEVTLPKANISEITYRENIDNLRFSRIPGLVKYDPIILRRGVTKNRDLYEWYRLVNDELALLNVAQELNRDSKYSTVQSENFRRDVVIEVLNREGKAEKAWYLLNAWPISYKPGNDLNAQSEEKLIEELTLTYEFFLELEGGIEGFAKEIARGALTGIAGSILKELPFLR